MNVEQLEEIQKQFIYKLEQQKAEINSVVNFRNGNSPAFTEVIERFNQKVRLFLESLLDEAQRASSENVSLKVSLKNSQKTLDAYRSAFENVSKSLTTENENFNRLYSNLIDIVELYFESENQAREVPVLKQKINQQQQQIQAYEKQYKAIIERYKVLASRQAVIDNNELLMKEITEQLSQKKNESEELLLLKAENETLKREKMENLMMFQIIQGEKEELAKKVEENSIQIPDLVEKNEKLTLELEDLKQKHDDFREKTKNVYLITKTREIRLNELEKTIEEMRQKYEVNETLDSAPGTETPAINEVRDVEE